MSHRALTAGSPTCPECGQQTSSLLHFSGGEFHQSGEMCPSCHAFMSRERETSEWSAEHGGMLPPEVAEAHHRTAHSRSPALEEARNYPHRTGFGEAVARQGPAQPVEDTYRFKPGPAGEREIAAWDEILKGAKRKRGQ
jgi:hypothetical protein